MTKKRLTIIIIIVVATVAAAIAAILLNLETVVVHEDITADLFFGRMDADEAARLRDESEALLALGDTGGALAVVTFAYTHHDGEVTEPLMLLWTRILFSLDKAEDGCQVLDELLVHYEEEPPVDDILGEALLSLAPERGYSVLVKLHSYGAAVESPSLPKLEEIIDALLDEAIDLEWAFSYEREMAYMDPNVARRDVGMAEMEAEREAPLALAALLTDIYALGAPPLEEQALISQPRLAEYLQFNDWIRYEVEGTSVDEIKEEEPEEVEEIEEVAEVAESADGEDDDDDPFAALTDAERARIDAALYEAAQRRPEERYTATTVILCQLEAFSLRGLVERLTLDPYTGRPAIAGELLVLEPVAEGEEVEEEEAAEAE
jgi:hypothetical protein